MFFRSKQIISNMQKKTHVRLVLKAFMLLILEHVNSEQKEENTEVYQKKQIKCSLIWAQNDKYYVLITIIFIGILNVIYVWWIVDNIILIIIDSACTITK